MDYSSQIFTVPGDGSSDPSLQSQPDTQPTHDAAAARILAKLIALGVDKVFDLINENGQPSAEKHIENHMLAWGSMVATLEAQEREAEKPPMIKVDDVYRPSATADISREPDEQLLRDAFSPEIMELNEVEPTHR